MTLLLLINEEVEPPVLYPPARMSLDSTLIDVDVDAIGALMSVITVGGKIMVTTLPAGTVLDLVNSRLDVNDG